MGPVAKALMSVLSTATLVSAQSSSCVSLEGSTQCSAFQSASVSTTGFVQGILYVNSKGYPYDLCSLVLAALSFNMFPAEKHSTASCSRTSRHHTSGKSRLMSVNATRLSNEWLTL